METISGKSNESDFTEDKPSAVSVVEAAMFLLPDEKVEGIVVKVVAKAAVKEGEEVVVITA